MLSRLIGSRRRWQSVLDILFGTGALAIGLKFPTYWNQWVYFPTIPNILDTVFLSLLGTYMMVRGWGVWSRSLKSKPTDTSALQPAAAIIVMVALTFGLLLLLYLVVRWTLGI